MQKPSTKNIALIVGAAAIIGAALIVSKYENPAYASWMGNASKNGTQGGSSGLDIPAITASATTSDGSIPYSGNWEKTLSTAVSGVWGGSDSATTASSAPLTPTDIFGRDLFTRYAQAESSGQDLTDPTVQQAVVGEVLADGTVLPTPKLYTEADLNISPDNSVAAITAYGNAAALPYVENFIQHESELTIVQDSLDNNDSSALKQLDPIIAEYQGMLKGELAVTVPSSMAGIHLQLVNAFSELAFADQGFEKTFSDGLTSLNGLSVYQQGASDLDTALTGIETRLSLSDIKYATSDPGIIFTYNPQ